ncbi:hypothetical protein FB567DRAFT_97700 [Paraphoma chrysanthemicola]|uniref:Ubiquitin-like protease family profile domain-containing protein n=1 Tax=Paraphoma chrysanthemicola TaxID=798071 RepID=A0A8K0VWJ5_9PLEO|nr:hypothetical protein FB567DRAFT_97700 [Paraphoma chrysanthemicola]
MEDITLINVGFLEHETESDNVLVFEHWMKKNPGARVYDLQHLGKRERNSQTMRAATNTMQLTSSRGFEREGFAPTRKTSPPMRSRRYSVDVITAEPWVRMPRELSEHGQLQVRLTNNQKYRESLGLGLATSVRHLEPVPPPTPVLSFPDPHRYPVLGLFKAFYPWAFDPNYDHNRTSQSMYLELGTACLHNESVHLIKACNSATYGPECWMRGESLGMALEVLRRDMNGDAFDIGVADENAAQMMNYANLYGDARASGYDSMRQQFGDKKWIFILVNDAIPIKSDGPMGEGTHWSLIALDRIHNTAHYYDSLWIGRRDQAVRAIGIIKGALAILEEQEQLWSFREEYESPHQGRENTFLYDEGACGPFVWKMTEWLMTRIRRYRDNNDEARCSLMLFQGFPDHFREYFNSRDVRHQMLASIAIRKATQVGTEATDAHDVAALKGCQDVTLIGPAPEMVIPPRLRYTSGIVDWDLPLRRPYNTHSRNNSNSSLDTNTSNSSSNSSRKRSHDSMEE